MTHLNVETLSSYLDGELVDAKVRKLETHLDQCPRCQARLRGLRRVVERLSVIVPIGPPTYLEPEVRRFVALQQSRESTWSRLELQMARFSAQSPLIPLFAVVIALVLIIYLLASGLSRQVGSGTEIVIAPTEIENSEMREIGSRVFEKQADRWVEQGWIGKFPVRKVDTKGAELAGWITIEPALAELEELGAVVWIVLDDEPVEIDYSRP